MDRVTIQPGQLPLETDLLQAEQFTMIGLAKLAEAVLGTGTVVDGFTIAPTSPPSLSVVIGGGTIYTLENIEATQWSSMAADTRSILKQGISLDAQSVAIAAPTTPGTSQAFLIQVGYSDVDDGLVTRPYFDAENPDVPFEGPGNDGSEDATHRRGAAAFQVKGGLAVSTGSPIVPAPDPGFVGLFTVTLSYGAGAISAGNLAIYPYAPFITPKLPQIPGAIQSSKYVYARDTGTAGHIIAAVSPPPAALVEGMGIRIRANMACNGPTGFALNGFPELPVTLQGGTALASGAYPAGAMLELLLDGNGHWQVNGLSSTVTGTEGVQVVSASAKLAVHELSENDDVAAPDEFVYYDASTGVHVKIPFSALSAAIIASLSATPGSAALLNPSPIYLVETRDKGTNPRAFQAGQWMPRIFTDIDTSLPGASLNTSTGGVTIPAGTYRFAARGSGHNCGLHQIRIVFPDGSIVLGGTMDSHVNVTGNATGTTNDSNIFEFRKSFSSPATIFLQHCSFNTVDNSLGEMGDDSVGLTTFIDAQLSITKEVGTP